MSAAKVRLVLRQSLQLLCDLLLGVAIANVLIIGYCSVLNWHRGGSPDPRCAAGIKGYVEVHNLDFKPARISCMYEPQVGAP
jgi:hypothetical protein